VVLALEKIPEGVDLAYAQVIERASAKELRGFFAKHISTNAKIITDEWKGYKIPLKNEYPELEQRQSNEWNAYIDLHVIS